MTTETSGSSADEPVPGGAIDPGLWNPKSRVSAREVARYTRFVKVMKLGLPALAALLLGIVIVYPLLQDQADALRTDLAPSLDGNPESLSMVNARYFGIDQKGQPFSITAQSIDEDSDTSEKVFLTGPQADISMNDGSWVMVGAETGLYDRGRETLNLTGDVNLFQDEGHELHTASAEMDLKGGIANGSDRVTSQGPFGQLQAEGFTFEKETKIVRFKGPAKLTLLTGGG